MTQELDAGALVTQRNEAISEANARYYRLLNQLQESCSHTDLSVWLSDNECDCRICTRCHKVMETRSARPDVNGCRNYNARSESESAPRERPAP
jgi:hypothetical protein